ncbi:MAG TPA: hypothetical protein PLZ58_02430 [Candidatus Saccharibacteria bacterium]|nr:hypothetical protein [Candidatus Saccharibacteria bacterium]HRQ06633.1 hypothetical protein [Candidatus Saccharibacteria bacterium]
MLDQSIIFLFAALIIVGGLLFAFIGFNRKGSRQLDVEKYRVKWLKIEQCLKRSEPSSCSLAILEADKLVDQALKDRGFVGDTMGERMKYASKVFSDRNGVWAAHKLRNKLAHETDFTVSYDQARQALAGFKKALKDVGAI